jgi:nucleotide-binding universal stress UspA family protein
MAIKHILARIDGSPSDIAVLDYALAVAAKLSAHVDVLHCRFAPSDLSRLTAKPKARTGLDGLVAEYADEAALRARDHFDRWLRANELIEGEAAPTGCAFSWRELVGWESDLLATATRLTDLTIMAKPDRTTVAGMLALETALFESHRPVLMVPEGPRADLFYRPIIAWNGSLEASQAIKGALPILAASQDPTEIFAVDEPHRDADPHALLAYLHWHGIVAAPTPRNDESGIGDALLRQARARRSGLIVMGAYTHGHVRQMLFGGVTRQVIEQATQPVLMAH